MARKSITKVKRRTTRKATVSMRRATVSTKKEARSMITKKAQERPMKKWAHLALSK